MRHVFSSQRFRLLACHIEEVPLMLSQSRILLWGYDDHWVSTANVPRPQPFDLVGKRIHPSLSIKEERCPLGMDSKLRLAHIYARPKFSFNCHRISITIVYFPPTAWMVLAEFSKLFPQRKCRSKLVPRKPLYLCSRAYFQGSNVRIPYTIVQFCGWKCTETEVQTLLV